MSPDNEHTISQIDAKFTKLEKEFESQARQTNIILERLTSLLETAPTIPSQSTSLLETEPTIRSPSTINEQQQFETQK